MAINVNFALEGTERHSHASLTFYNEVPQPKEEKKDANYYTPILFGTACNNLEVEVYMGKAGLTSLVNQDNLCQLYFSP